MERAIWRGGLACIAAVTLVLGVQAAAQQLRLPADIVYGGAGASPGKVVFSHQVHTAVSDKCTACHVTLFRMLRPARQVTHTDMDAGRSCGACHNGQMAFGSTDPAGCARCHAGEGKPS